MWNIKDCNRMVVERWRQIVIKLAVFFFPILLSFLSLSLSLSLCLSVSLSLSLSLSLSFYGIYKEMLIVLHLSGLFCYKYDSGAIDAA
jgi:hypothetical protein